MTTLHVEGCDGVPGQRDEGNGEAANDDGISYHEIV
jgi:hypothetical protein